MLATDVWPMAGKNGCSPPDIYCQMLLWIARCRVRDLIHHCYAVMSAGLSSRTQLGLGIIVSIHSAR